MSAIRNAPIWDGVALPDGTRNRDALRNWIASKQFVEVTVGVIDRGTGLEAMELRDQFGQITVIKFSTIERNAKLAPEAFRFTPPKGADVLGD